jgi:adenosine deaminase
MELVEAVQFKMQHELKDKNIGIETNPTSNYLIGTFKRYAKHPITKFHNLGLELDNELIRNCPQLSVSINTDDQGIFSTSLENEYALMAIALEKEKDENGKLKYNSSMIYEWLERIRQMSIGQSFKN